MWTVETVPRREEEEMKGRIALLVVVLIVSVGCASYVPRADEIRDVRMDMVDLKPEDASIGGIEWETTVRIANPNPFDLRIEYLEVSLDISGSRLGTGTRKGFTVKKFEDKEVDISVYTSSLGMATTIMGAIQSKDFSYTMNAEVTYKTQEGPLRRSLPPLSGSIGR